VSHRPRKRFGQNFLVDDAVIRRISDAVSACEGQLLIEIGPGRAALTAALLESGAEVIALEIDRDLAAELERRFAAEPRLRVINADALQTGFAELAAGREYRLVGNLPYNISTPLLFHVLAARPAPLDMHFMLQKEVVRRMAAQPGGKDWGRLSVTCQNLSEVAPLFDIGPESFDPPPRVESTLVRLVPRAEPQSGAELIPALDRVVKQAFSKRRKTLRNALSGLLETDQIESAGADPALRAEQLSLDQFIALARKIV
jgi:16S rRNA (adenine1518-N6/adenine1519-N6)-dimethyltransferase